MAYSRERLQGSVSHGSDVRAFQRVEWSIAEQEAWLIDQAWEGGLRTFDQGAQNQRRVLLVKTTIAGLAESTLKRLCKLSGDSAYTWDSPLGVWYEDVCALGYLRPPWALAFDQRT